MSYLIKGASGPNGLTKEFLIRERKIAYIARRMERERTFEMNCDGFYIVPAGVRVDHSMVASRAYTDRKKKFIEWQRQGTTIVLIVCPLQYEKDLESCLRKARHLMINSSIDYVIGVSFPLHKLTPSFIRQCVCKKIPFVQAVVHEQNDLNKVTWEWIRNAHHSYRFPIVPDWSKLNLDSKQRKKLNDQWLSIANRMDIPTISHFPNNEGMLNKEAKRKIGIAPFKGELRTGCDLDYNLYKSTSLADPTHFLYDKDSEPDVVVLRGKLMKAGESVHYRPGYGKEITVRVPGYLASYPDKGRVLS